MGLFLVFAILFVGIYFLMRFGSRQNSPGYSDTESDYTFINKDTSKYYKDGKALFQNKCASCHGVHIDITGPALAGVTKRGPWTSRKNIYDFLKNLMKFRPSDKSCRN